MASGSGLDLLKCGICSKSKVGRTPRGLVCLHSFCHDCLFSRKVIRDTTYNWRVTGIQCPLCQSFTTLRERGIGDLPIDFKVAEIDTVLSKKGNRVVCKKCESAGILKPVQAACKTCYQYFCEECSAEHPQTKLFSDHVVVNSICDKHGGPLEYICLTCWVGICVNCVMSDQHVKHDINDLDSCKESLKSGFIMKSTMLKDARDGLTNCLDKKIKEDKVNRLEMEKKLTNIGQKLKSRIDTLVSETIQNHYGGSKISGYDVTLKKIEDVFQDIEKLMKMEPKDVVTQLLRFNNDMNTVLNLTHETQQKLDLLPLTQESVPLKRCREFITDLMDSFNHYNTDGATVDKNNNMKRKQNGFGDPAAKKVEGTTKVDKDC